MNIPTTFYIPSLEALESILDKYEILHRTWQGTKSLSDLFEELTKGESELLYDEDLGLFRKVRIVYAYITHYSDSGIHELYEAEQRLRDGTVRERSLFPGKKISGENTPLQTLEDLFKSELGWNGCDYSIQEYIPHKSITKESDSYPGLKTLYIGCTYKCGIRQSLFIPDGYSHEEVPGVTTIFKWRTPVVPM
jgi:hypothetical protein